MIIIQIPNLTILLTGIRISLPDGSDLDHQPHGTAVLYKLGYLELCVGDEHKARLLLEAMAMESSELGRKALLAYGTASRQVDPVGWTKSTMKGFQRHVKDSPREVKRDAWFSLGVGLLHSFCFWELLQLRAKMTEEADFPQEHFNFAQTMLAKKQAKQLRCDGQRSGRHRQAI